MSLDWLRVWPEFVRLNLQKARHARRLRAAARTRQGPPSPAPCQSASDSGRAHLTRCEACLRLDRAARYRFVCPALRLRPDGAFCSLDSADIRPRWTRALLALSAPPLCLAVLAILVAWALLRFAVGLDQLRLVEVAWPPFWSRVEQDRRAHFQDLALRAIRDGDIPAASVALFSAARTTSPNPAENIALARLATIASFHSLADDIHARNLVAHPEHAAELALAWHDDLLVGDRPLQLARLSLDQLALPGTPREFWLRAFFESIRHPGVAAALLDSPPPLPHPGLRHALQARAALAAKDRIAAADSLLALEGALPGQAARRFLVLSWLDNADSPRARAAALSLAHPAPAGEIAALAHAVFRVDGDIDQARAALRSLFTEPSLRPLVLAALVRDPDRELLREFAATLPREADTPPELQGGLWFAARLSGAGDLAARSAAALARAGRAVPSELQEPEPDNGRDDAKPLRRERLALSAPFLPLDREVLVALRAAP